MIRIIKPGKKINYEFICTECGCEYLADQEEVLILFYDVNRNYTCYCPNCGVRNFGKQIECEENRK